MITSSETQKRFEARNKALTCWFLAKLNIEFIIETKSSDMFYDKVSKRVIRINKTQTCKAVLMNKLNKVRGNHVR